MENKNDYTPLDGTSYELIDNIIDKYFEDENFKTESIFSSNSPVNRTAYVNWRVNDFYSKWHQFTIMGYAYLDASFNLTVLTLKENHHKEADSLIFPILFNVIHGIEIYLKGLISGFNIALYKDDTSIPFGHNISYLTKEIKNIALEFSEEYLDVPMKKEFKRVLEIIEELIDNIYIETNDMTFPRYPSGKKGNKTIPHFYVEKKENVTVDLALLAEQIVVIFCIFDYMETVIMEVSEHIKDMEY